MPKTLHADGFLFKRNPSPTGGGWTVVDAHGKLIERQAILKRGLTCNEAELTAVYRAAQLVDEGGTVFTDSKLVCDWIETGRSKKRSDLNKLIRACKGLIEKKSVSLRFRSRKQNLAGIYNDRNRPNEDDAKSL
ncbi:hypothetical protein SV7mr_20040 [Stieleria bergensis]|uniref:RNase H type-1 domain-containing protein n=1 Tax=Stieleria bergensis TaxID=2528025 RepID=A0A517STP8_9BACT|nr:hypothetical protein SV7mr_20040 [Planctomycetes bacterium SV_7m_r]